MIHPEPMAQRKGLELAARGQQTLVEAPKPPQIASSKRFQPLSGLKRLSRMVFRRDPYRIFSIPGTNVDFHRQVGDGTNSSIVMSCLNWITRTFPEAPPALWRQLDNGQKELVLEHPILRLLQMPMPTEFGYSGVELWMATLVDYNVDGNAYWLKIRNKETQIPEELWYVPHFLIEPKGTQTKFITHYEYKPGYEPISIRPEDIVHFRNGLDPDDSRKGCSVLKSILREVYTDDEASTFTASLLRNMGIPGLIVSPDGDRPISQEDADATKQYMKEQFGGDRRGEPMVMSGPTKVSQFGFSPEQLLLKEVRRIPEERITAALGVPAIVAGMGAGLDRSTFTNYTEAREAAYEQNIIPTQRTLANTLRFQLLTDFMGKDGIWGWQMGFDLSEVRVLQEDENAKLRRLDVGVRGGFLMVSEARQELGYEVVPERDEVYLRQLNLVQVPGDGSEPVPLSPPSSNGNGAGAQQDREEVAATVARELERAR